MSKNSNIECLPEEIIETMQKNIYHNYIYFTSYSNINQNYLFIRNSLFALIQKISNKMNFKSQTYFLSIYYLDLIFLKNKIPSLYNENYELLGLTCLVLAAKHSENDPTVPQLQHFVNTYNSVIKQIMHNYESKIIYNYGNISFKDLKLSEVVTCKILNYKLNYFTIYDFNSFFFGNGILNIELLKNIREEDFNKKNNNDDYSDENEEENDENDDEMDYIDPNVVKSILEKIYKKSRLYLNIVVKNRISLKYDSFLISIYIMYKSVEYVLLKELRILNEEKDQDKYYIEKKEENLRRKTSKCFKEIMNDIYKIELDSLEEYQFLINDDEFLKLFNPLKSNNKAVENNNKNEFDISERLDKIHRKYQSNNIDAVQKNNKNQKTEKMEKKEFSPKKISHMKIPSEKYNRIRRLKILERLNKNTKSSKNSFNKSFLFANAKEDENNNKDILNKSNNKEYNNIINQNKSTKTVIKNKTIIINENSDALFDSYKLGNKTKQYQNETSFINDTNTNIKNTTIFEDSYLNKYEKKNQVNIPKKNANNSEINFTDINIEINNNIKKRNNIKQNEEKFHNKDNSAIIIKPYSKKIIQKIEKKNNKILNINRNNNFNKKDDNNCSNINRSINVVSKNKNIIPSNDINFRKSNADKYKNNILDTNVSNSIDIQKDYTSYINTKYSRVNIKKSKDKNIVTKEYKNKNRHMPAINNDEKKPSMSVNKIKVNGVSNKNKLNKKLFFLMHKTPMKTEKNLKNALKRNIGVKRDNNINIVISKNNSQDNSVDESIKEKDNNNIDKTDSNNNNDYSCIKLHNRKIIKIKNDINDDIKTINNDLIKIKDKRNNELSSSGSDNEECNEYNDNIESNNYKLRINKYGENKYKYVNGKVRRYKIKKILDNKNDKNMPKIELFHINKKKSPTIVINNNINVNFEPKIGVIRPASKLSNYNVK